MSFKDTLSDLGGYWRDIEVAKVSNDGSQTQETRPESVPDQTTMNRQDLSGPNPMVGGFTMSPNLLILAALGLAAVVVAVRGGS